MEKFSELIRIRRSMRKFTEEELNQDEVVALLRAALISPSSKGVRPWEFVVVDNKELLQQLAHCKEHGAELVEGAPLAVVVLADPTQSDVWVEDASVATTMMLRIWVWVLVGSKSGTVQWRMENLRRRWCGPFCIFRSI